MMSKHRARGGTIKVKSGYMENRNGWARLGGINWHLETDQTGDMVMFSFDRVNGHWLRGTLVMDINAAIELGKQLSSLTD